MFYSVLQYKFDCIKVIETVRLLHSLFQTTLSIHLLKAKIRIRLRNIIGSIAYWKDSVLFSFYVEFHEYWKGKNHSTRLVCLPKLLSQPLRLYILINNQRYFICYELYGNWSNPERIFIDSCWTQTNLFHRSFQSLELQ